MKLLVAVCAVVFTATSASPIKNEDLVWMESGKFEGDMVLNQEQMLSVLGLGSKNGLIDKKYRWPKNEVPYVIVGGYFNRSQINYIHKAVAEFRNISCVKVRPKKVTDTKYVQITGLPGGCYSSVGFQDGVQTLNLAPYEIEKGCFRKATIQHEFLHALGFYHQQSTHDRDEYVTIMWDNILPNTEHNFNIYTASTVQDFGTEYDYLSVMHYGAYGFSKNGERTIVTKDPAMSDVIGQRVKISDIDIVKLNKMYCGRIIYIYIYIYYM
ncbi:LOW QUALITY PROTEIN: meprin A subunit beta-like [Ctenocephalides felis]|uniref:LOW QUALITY PROTEIN: meprin A subunit beta-like n=1 Tax=Ctenocephalides felis TaxID=7515 RepID=UPI000E6E49DD|nr:LOW QUALITY PROTEIN: meprin A subunit beta-like [Ctenocephalides felis]